MNVDAMDSRTRLNLVKMACVAAWADGSVDDSEREMVVSMAHRFDVAEEFGAQIKRWLTEAPPEFDPFDIPHSHRKAFLDAFVEVIRADGRIDPDESESIRLLRELSGEPV